MLRTAHFGFLLLLAAGMLSRPTAMADEPQSTAGGAQATEEPAADPFAPPEGTDSEAIMLFLQRLQRLPPTERTLEGVLAHLSKIDGVLAEVLSRNLEDDTYEYTAQLRLNLMSALGQYGDEEAAANREKFIEELKKSTRPGVPKMLARIDLQMKIAQAESLEDSDPASAVAVYREAIAAMKALEDEQILALVPQIEATIRRLDLLGNAMEVSGKTVKGEEFNIDQLKGKVVLVDFWATWCGPCVAEMPHVKEMYEAYHSVGFEVVGISLDHDMSALESFIKEREIPWATLSGESAEKIAQHYGIRGIPTVILVNKEGKVVNLNARGPILTQELEKLLGPKPESTEKPEGTGTSS